VIPLSHARHTTFPYTTLFRSTGTREVWEFGAGTGALALQILDELQRLGVEIERYTIVDLSGTLRARQQAKLVAHGGKVVWANARSEEHTSELQSRENLVCRLL